LGVATATGVGVGVGVGLGLGVGAGCSMTKSDEGEGLTAATRYCGAATTVTAPSTSAIKLSTNGINERDFIRTVDSTAQF